MRTKDFTRVSLAAGGAAIGPASAAGEGAVETLVSRIKNSDDKVRTEAWLGAGKVGAPAVKPLAKVMTDSELEVARAAKRALWAIVRHAGRPGAEQEKQGVEAELLELLAGSQPSSVCREVLWMLSEIGGNRCVKPVAALLSDKDLREDARMVLQRIPGRRSLAALKAGLKAAPEDFKINIAQSLRQRGVEVFGLPCVKLVPTRPTSLQPG